MSGFRSPRPPSAHDLWEKANREMREVRSRDVAWRQKRYHDLMVEHGLIIPGKPKPLPCGWSPSPAASPGEET